MHTLFERKQRKGSDICGETVDRLLRFTDGVVHRREVEDSRNADDAKLAC